MASEILDVQISNILSKSANDAEKCYIENWISDTTADNFRYSAANVLSNSVASFIDNNILSGLTEWMNYSEWIFFRLELRKSKFSQWKYLFRLG